MATVQLPPTQLHARARKVGLTETNIERTRPKDLEEIVQKLEALCKNNHPEVQPTATHRGVATQLADDNGTVESAVALIDTSIQDAEFTVRSFSIKQKVIDENPNLDCEDKKWLFASQELDLDMLEEHKLQIAQKTQVIRAKIASLEVVKNTLCDAGGDQGCTMKFCDKIKALENKMRYISAKYKELDVKRR
jgi:hypothetical protein